MNPYDEERRQLEAHKNAALMQLQFEHRDRMGRASTRYIEDQDEIKRDYASRVVTLRSIHGLVVEGEDYTVEPVCETCGGTKTFYDNERNMVDCPDCGLRQEAPVDPTGGAFLGQPGSHR